ncbi:MAG: hypothetical protein IJ746_00685 [Ruminococcus sp.]|nr:hypothetical protein [Ruminococcus sp.]
MGYYVLCEDSGSGYQFWKKLFESLYPDFTLETKKNNSQLSKAVERIEDDGNIYYILIDSAVDNPDVLRELARLKKYMAGKPCRRKLNRLTKRKIKATPSAHGGHCPLLML